MALSFRRLCWIRISFNFRTLEAVPLTCSQFSHIWLQFRLQCYRTILNFVFSLLAKRERRFTTNVAQFVEAEVVRF